MNKMNTNLESLLVDHIINTGYDDLPSATIDCCKLMLMDSLGVTIPGSRAPGCEGVIRLARKWSVDSGSSVLIHGLKTTPSMAALANSTMMHALDFDDTLDASALHTYVSVLPAALAAAEATGRVNGKTFISALVLGIDIICRLSFGISRPLSWIRTATCGGFGAATAAAKIMGLNREQTANALGIVYSQTAGNAQGLVEGRLVKRMQPGFASSAGVTSAFLAEQGITGSLEFLNGTYGFYQLYEQGEYNIDPVMKDLGKHFSILDLSIKPYPSCRMTHSSIDAALELRQSLTDKINQIDRIDITASRMVAEMVGKPFIPGDNPQVDAQFSVPYTVATALLYGEVFLEHFEPELILKETVQILARKISVSIDDTLPAKDIFNAEMRIIMQDKTSTGTKITAPTGNPAKPMSLEQCREKFNKCISASGLDYADSRINRLLETIEKLEEMKDVSILSELMKR